MGFRDFYGSSLTGGTGKAKGFQRDKRIFNIEHTAAQKEAIYKNRLNIMGWIRQKFNSNKTREKETAVATSEMENFSAAAEFNTMIDTYNKYVYQTEASKEQKIQIYREMAKYPVIDFAVSEYVSEAINPNKDGRVMEMRIIAKNLNENVRKTIEAEWDYLMYDTLKVDENASINFRDFIIDGEFGYEKVIDNDKPQSGVVRIKKLRTTRLHPIWNDLDSDEIIEFVYKTETDILKLDPEMVAYANSGMYEYNKEEDDKVIIGLLEPAKTTYKRLKQMEDSLVIYRLVNAPSRKVFKIDVGAMPQGKVAGYMTDLMKKYRQRKFFNSATGEVSESLDVMAMTEDYWFPVFQGGRASDVQVLQGGENLGKIEDITYFQENLFRSLKVPTSRFSSDTGFSIGDTSDITREEVKFVKQVRWYSDRFVRVYKSIFLTHLKLKGILEVNSISEKDIIVTMFTNNLFDKFMEAKILALKFDNFDRIKDMLAPDDNGLIPKEWAFKKFLELTDTEYGELQEQLTAEKAAREASGDNQKKE